MLHHLPPGATSPTSRQELSNLWLYATQTLQPRGQPRSKGVDSAAAGWCEIASGGTLLPSTGVAQAAEANDRPGYEGFTGVFDSVTTTTAAGKEVAFLTLLAWTSEEVRRAWEMSEEGRRIETWWDEREDRTRREEWTVRF